MSAYFSILGALSSALLFFFFPILVLIRRVVHTRQHRGDESLRVFVGLASFSFTDPFFLSSPFSDNLVPDTPTVVPVQLVFQSRALVRVFFFIATGLVDCHSFVFLLLDTCFKV